LHDLSLYVLELLENSLRAKATAVEILVEICREDDVLRLSVEDNGEGIRVAPAALLDPFYTTKESKRVGLGLSLFKEALEMAHGQLTLSRSETLGGVAVRATAQLSHVNRPPLGDLAATLSAMVLTNSSVDFRLTLRSAEGSYRFRLPEFAKENALDIRANVDLASAVFVALRAELEVWKRYDLMCARERWRLAMDEQKLRAAEELDQGVNA